MSCLITDGLLIAGKDAEKHLHVIKAKYGDLTAENVCNAYCSYFAIYVLQLCILLFVC